MKVCAVNTGCHSPAVPEERQGDVLQKPASPVSPEPAETNPQMPRPSVPMLEYVCVCVGDLQGGATPLPLVCFVVRKFLNQTKPLTGQPVLTSSCVASANRNCLPSVFSHVLWLEDSQDLAVQPEPTLLSPQQQLHC